MRYARKRIYHACLVQQTNSSLRITIWHHSTKSCDAKQWPSDRFFYPHLIPMKDSHFQRPLLASVAEHDGSSLIWSWNFKDRFSHDVAQAVTSLFIWATPWENLSYAIYKQQRCRSACRSMQSNQRLCFRCLNSIINTYTCFILKITKL